jgi:hypothetical protein
MIRFTTLLLIMLSGCVLVDPPKFKFENESDLPDNFPYEWAGAVEMVSGVHVDMSDMHIHIYGDKAKFDEVCVDAKGQGCTDGYTYVNILGTFDHSVSEVAAECAHQLGHIYFYQKNGDIDGAHTHGEWFGDDENSVVEILRAEVKRGILTPWATKE